MSWKERAASLDREAVRRLLRGVRLPTDPTPRLATERLLVCLDADEETRLRAIGAGAWVQVTGREGLEQASQYPVVLVAGDEQVDADEAIDLPLGCGLADVAPEAVLSWFHHNRDLLRAQAALASLLGRTSRAEEALRIAESARRSETTPADLHAAVEAVRKEAEARLRERVAALSLRGDEILLALGSRLPPALDAILKDTIAHAHRELRSRTGCDLQPLRAGFPLTVDEQEVERAERELEGSGRRQAFQAQVRAARQLQPLVAELTQEARAWLAFDADFALGCFALAHDLREPTFGDRLSLRDSIHLELADPAAIADGSHQAITYELGGQHPVAVLTGANSGGKTTLLEHVCQVVAMARLGLPVVGEATVPWVDEIHYVTARKGLDAGAFEAFLRTFLPVLQGSRRRLVLADEVEAVTELESAGRILGFFADRAARAGIPTILVTHMAPQILQHASEAASGRIRVDGIEATGLDEQHRLIVDRVPRMGHFARSTPELIVQRLAATTRGAEGELFAELARTLASGGRGAALPDSGDGHVAAPGPLASRRRTRPA